MNIPSLGFLFSRSLHILIVIAVVYAVTRLIDRWLRRTSHRLEQISALPGVGRRSTTILALAANTAKYLLFLIGAVTVLAEIGINLAPLLTGAGIAGLAIGFGAQSLVKDVVSGFFIIFEGQFAVGDLVEINGVLGTIEEVGLRVTRLRSATGDLRFFPNGSITAVSNYPERSVPFQINVPVSHLAEEQTCRIVETCLHQFHNEFSVFADRPALVATTTRAADVPVLSYRVKVHPSQRSLCETRLPTWLTTELRAAKLELPDGAEVAVFVKVPATTADPLPEKTLPTDPARPKDGAFLA